MRQAPGMTRAPGRSFGSIWMLGQDHEEARLSGRRAGTWRQVPQKARTPEQVDGITQTTSVYYKECWNPKPALQGFGPLRQDPEVPLMCPVYSSGSTCCEGLGASGTLVT